MDDLKIKELYEKFHTPPHIREHCAQVAKVAVLIGKALIEKGILVNIEQLREAGLLHDLVRIVDFKKWPPVELYKDASIDDITAWEALREKYKGLHHADAAVQILLEIGEKKLAKIVEKHKFKTILEQNGFDNWEEKILYYADKRVQHEEIVDLRARLEDGKKRNAPEDEDRSEKVLALEKEICEKAGISPEDIK